MTIKRTFAYLLLVTMFGLFASACCWYPRGGGHRGGGGHRASLDLQVAAPSPPVSVS